MAERPQERHGEQQTPEADGDRADIRQTDEPRPERKRGVAGEQRGKGEAVRLQGPYCSRSA
jgi:hypothetical protein